METTQLIELWGPFALLLIVGVWYIKRLTIEKDAEREERRAAQQSEKETLQSVIPAVASLEKALAHIERTGS